MMHPSGGTHLRVGKGKKNRYNSSGGDHGHDVVSARKLVAELWRLTAAGVTLQGDLSRPSKLQLAGMTTIHKMEAATNWDIVLKLVGKQVRTMSAASAVQTEIKRAQLRIHELECDSQLFKKKLEEARMSRERRQSRIVQSVLDDLMLEFKRETRTRKRLEFLNSKLINELQKAKSSAEQFKKEYEAEKNCREATEEVCNKLADRVAEDKASFDVLKMESIRIQAELEEERKMLQVAEVWREERVQMKLIDAKLSLEDKYRRMSSLISELEGFLGSGRTGLTLAELQKAEMIREAAKLIKVDGGEFSYEHPDSNDMYYILQEIREFEATRWAVAPVNKHKHSPVCNASRAPSSCFTSDSTTSAQISEVRSLPVEKKLQNRMPGIHNGRIDRNIPSNYDCSRRQSSSTICSTVTASSDEKSSESRKQLREIVALLDSSDHHVAEEVKGCTELLGGIQKNSLKAKLLEARLESQQARMCNAIEQAS